MAALLEQLRLWIEQIITLLGYPGITVVMFVENIFPPIPSELIMPFSGFMVANQSVAFSFPGIVLAGSVGSVLGALVLYQLGRWSDERVARRFVRHYGGWFFLSEADLDRSLRFFTDYGDVVIFFGRLIPIVRSLISLPAGMNRMPMGRFLLFTTLGSIVWNGALAYAGYLLGANWPQVINFVGRYQDLTVVVVMAILSLFVARRLHRLLLRRALP